MGKKVDSDSDPGSKLVKSGAGSGSDSDSGVGIAHLWLQLTYLKDSILGPDLLGLTVGQVQKKWSDWTYSCWIRALNVNFSIFCALLYRTSLKSLIFQCKEVIMIYCVKPGVLFWKYQYIIKWNPVLHQTCQCMSNEFGSFVEEIQKTTQMNELAPIIHLFLY